MQRIGIRMAISGLVFGATLGVAPSTAATVSGATAGPTIHIEDVERFFRIYDAAGGHPTADQLQKDYLDAGSDGLHQLAKTRDVTGARIADTLAKRPEIYSGARRCLVALPRARERLAVALHTLGRLYPEARFPPVTIAVSRGKPVAAGSPVFGLQVGLEALCAFEYINPNVEDRFVYVIAHEYAHFQQAPALTEKELPTLLERSLLEGAAEFTSELIAGKGAYSLMAASTQGHEKDIETAFVTDVDKTDLSDWIDNSTLEKPGDLGYWVGCRIVKAYYQRASDKRQALRDILEMTDAKDFLAKSGWSPGIQLQ